MSEKNDFTPMFGMGDPNEAYAQYFIGNSYLNPLTSAVECGVGLANVTFEPGCRNNWHIHHADPEGVKHWHGAARDSWFSHIAFEAPGENCSNEWLEPVTDEQYPA